MASSRLKEYGMAAGLAVVTASGIVGIAAVMLGVTVPQCGPGGAGCAREERALVATVSATDSAVGAAARPRREAPPAELQPPAAEPARQAVAERPRREPQPVEAAAAAVMADQIERASIKVTPARVVPKVPTAPVEAPAATAAAAPRVAPLPVPEPLAPMTVQEEESEQAVASELSVVPSDAVGLARKAQAAEVALAAPAKAEPPAAPEPEPAAEFRSVAGSGVNVRSGPSNDSGKLFALAGGTRVEVTGEERGWLNVVDPDGRSGWAYGDFLE